MPRPVGLKIQLRRLITHQFLKVISLKITGLVSWRIGIGDILRQNFLSLAQPGQPVLDDAKKREFAYFHYSTKRLYSQRQVLPKHMTDTH